MADQFLAKGTKFEIDSGGASFHQVLQITSLVWSGRKLSVEDTTNHDSTTPVKTIKSTLYDNGTYSLTILWDRSDTYHALLETLSTTLAESTYKVTQVNSGDVDTFSGYVTDFSFDTPVNGILKAKVVVTINGAFA